MIKEALLIGKSEYKIPEGEFNVGRANDDNPANIKINEPLNLFVSKCHCKIYNDGEKLEVMDIGSRNGTYVNDNKIKEKVILKNGDKLRLAGCELEVKIVEESNILNKS